MGLYSHYVKQGNSGFLGAPTVSPRLNANQMPTLGKDDESRRYSWQTSKTPDPSPQQGQGPINRVGMWPFDNWYRTTPRGIFERNYGPELTEKLRQNARAYQQTHPGAMAVYGNDASAIMPDYSRMSFDTPIWVEQGSSPTHAIARASGVRDRSDLSKTLNGPDIFMDVGTDYNGKYTNPTAEYNSILQHEATHMLQPMPRQLWWGGFDPTRLSQRVVSGDYLEPTPYREYRARLNAGNDVLPYSRYPVELAPQVSQAKLEYYRYLKDIPSSNLIPSLERDIANFERRESPERTEYNPYELGNFAEHFEELYERQNEENLKQFAAARKQGLPPPRTNAPLPSDTYENILQKAKDRHDLIQATRNAQHRQQLEALREASSAPPEERMNFNDPDSYRIFLDWLRDSRHKDVEDVKWILDLPPEERDLYFKGIVSNQARNRPYQYYT